MNRLHPLTSSLSQALAGYPTWLVVAVAAAAALVALWVLGKMIKWTLVLLLIAALVCGIGYAVWMVLQALHLVPGPPHGP